MSRGLKGEKRLADVIGAAVMVGRIATGQSTRIAINYSVLRMSGQARWFGDVPDVSAQHPTSDELVHDVIQ